MRQFFLSKYKSLRILLFTFAIIELCGKNAALLNAQQLFQIVHFPITESPAGEVINIKATYDGNLQNSMVYLYYRTVGEASFEYIEMRPQMDGWEGEIPAEVVYEPGVEYFISAVTQSKQIITSPPQNPYNAPYRIHVDSKQNEIVSIHSPENIPDKEEAEEPKLNIEPDNFLILSPEEGQIFFTDNVIIALSFIGTSQSINWKTGRAYLNRKNITRKMRKSQGVLSFMPANLPPGNYEFIFRYKDKADKRQPEVQIKFTVLDNQQSGRTMAVDDVEKPYRGNVYFDLKQEIVSKKKLETNQFGGNLYGNYQSFKYQGKFYFTSRENDRSQPRNRFYLGVENKWFGFKWGDNNPYFNDLILYGKRVRGISAFVKTGIFNVEFVTGETQRAIKGYNNSEYVLNPSTGDTLYYNPNTSPPDTVNDGNTTDYLTKPIGFKYVMRSSIGTYRQLLTGFRPSFGRGDNFQLGLMYLKAKDQVSSIDRGYNPQDNFVVGSDILLAYDNHRIEFRGGIAFSMTTRDISKGIYSKTMIDSVFNVDFPFDPQDMENYLIMNETTTPLDPSGMSSLAYNGKFKFNYFNNSFEFQYKSIGPEYNSLGNTYLKKDIRGFGIIDRLRLIKNRVVFNVDYSFYEDNYFPDEIPITVIRTLNLGISLFLPARFPKITLNRRTQSRDNDIEIDAEHNPYGIDERVKNINTDFSLILSYDFDLNQLKNNMNFSLMSNSRKDLFERTLYDFETELILLSLNTKYQIPLRTIVTWATNENISGDNDSRFDYNMIDIKGEYSFFEDTWKVLGGFKNIAAKNENQNTDSLTFNRLYLQAGISAIVKKLHTILFNGYLINYSDNKDQKFQDKIFQLRYDYRF